MIRSFCFPGIVKYISKNILRMIDKAIFTIGIVLLMIVIITSTKMNITADSVDYYAILQWLTPENEKPIVQNLHFAEQRSPGYSLFSLIPYSVITLFVEPFVKTEKVGDNEISSFLMRRPEGKVGSETMFLPPQPLRIKDILFKDFYIPMEDSWFQWKLAFSLLLTSVIFLLLGIFANAMLLRYYFPSRSNLFLIPIIIATSPIFIKNIIEMPLYATMTAYGLSSLFIFLLCISYNSNKVWQIVLSGLLLGLLVLTRLELSILVILLIVYFLVARKFRFLVLFSFGGLIALLVLIFYNLFLFGTPLHLGILRGDINIINLNWRYIFENLFHPESGVLFWTPLLIPGLIFLVIGKDTILRVIGFCSIILIICYTLRVPIMYYHVGEGIINIGGIPVTAPETLTQMRELIRYDINRYLSVLIPFSSIGIRIGINKINNLLKYENK